MEYHVLEFVYRSKKLQNILKKLLRQKPGKNQMVYMSAWKGEANVKFRSLLNHRT